MKKLTNATKNNRKHLSIKYRFLKIFVIRDHKSTGKITKVLLLLAANDGIAIIAQTH